MNKAIITATALFSCAVLFTAAMPQPTPQSVNNDTDSLGTIVDEVIWVVGDEAILKSDVEALRLQGQQEGMHWKLFRSLTVLFPNR